MSCNECCTFLDHGPASLDGVAACQVSRSMFSLVTTIHKFTWNIEGLVLLCIEQNGKLDGMEKIFIFYQLERKMHGRYNGQLRVYLSLPLLIVRDLI